MTDTAWDGGPEKDAAKRLLDSLPRNVAEAMTAKDPWEQRARVAELRSASLESWLLLIREQALSRVGLRHESDGTDSSRGFPAPLDVVEAAWLVETTNKALEGR